MITPPDFDRILAEQLRAIEQTMVLNKEIIRLFRDSREARCSKKHVGKLSTPPESPTSLRPLTWDGAPLENNFSNVMLLGKMPLPAAKQPSISSNADWSIPLLPQQGEPFHSFPEQSHNFREECDESRFPCNARLDNWFPETEELKQAVLQNLNKHRYNVEDCYQESGWWQAIARDSCFKNFTAVVIIVNLVYVGIQTDVEIDDTIVTPTGMFQVADNIFCTYFLFEIFARLMAFKNKREALRDCSFVFDGFLVALVVWDTWVMVLLQLVLGAADDPEGGEATAICRVFRLLRLFRVARVTRVVKNFPELTIMCNGIISGMRSVLAVVCLLILSIYVFAVIFTMSIRNTEVGKDSFSNVLQSMNSLMLQVLCGPDPDLMHSVLSVDWIYYVVFLAFIGFANLTVMNMLIGILCDAVATVAAESKADAFAKQVGEKIRTLADSLDTNGDGTISKAEFDVIQHDPQLLSELDELGVDLVGVVHFATFLFADCEKISYNRFVQMISQFHGSRMATVNDITDMRRYLTMELMHLERRLRHPPEALAFETNTYGEWA